MMTVPSLAAMLDDDNVDAVNARWQKTIMALLHLSVAIHDPKTFGGLYETPREAPTAEFIHAWQIKRSQALTDHAKALVSVYEVLCRQQNSIRASSNKSLPESTPHIAAALENVIWVLNTLKIQYPRTHPHFSPRDNQSLIETLQKRIMPEEMIAPRDKPFPSGDRRFNLEQCFNTQAQIVASQKHAQNTLRRLIELDVAYAVHGILQGRNPGKDVTHWFESLTNHLRNFSHATAQATKAAITHTSAVANVAAPMSRAAHH